MRQTWNTICNALGVLRQADAALDVQSKSHGGKMVCRGKVPPALREVVATALQNKFPTAFAGKALDRRTATAAQRIIQTPLFRNDQDIIAAQIGPADRARADHGDRNAIAALQHETGRTRRQR